MLRETHITRLPSGIEIIGRTDFDLKQEYRKARKLREDAKPYEKEHYILDHDYVNAVFENNFTRQRWVCRSVLRQWYNTGWALHCIFLIKSGSSMPRVVHSFSASAVCENEHANEFNEEYRLIETNKVKTCVYCDAPIDSNAPEFFECGAHRGYRWQQGVKLIGDHDKVHDRFLKE